MRNNGFTLIELMIVVSIIGILASVALPAYQTYTTRAQIVESLIIVGELKASVTEQYKAKGIFPINNKEAGIPDARYLLGNYVKNITLEGGAFHILLGNKANHNLADKILTIRPIIVTNSAASPLSWVCGNSGIPEGMEPIGENKTSIEGEFLPWACRG